MGWRGIAFGAGLGFVLGGSLGAAVGAAICYAVGRGRGRAFRRQWMPPSPEEGDLARAYATLGADPSEPMDSVRRKYRALAKRNHPDVLRAQGGSEASVGMAATRMARINAAWAAVRAARAW